ncbi:YcxB-like protein [Litoreibacter ponti]|uniref:YcxB-like protein n=1 Tax=Litoreibacter ponti TaxID=1510457 RepID=A0A2T6BKC6_9RHOB|nr:YcxB family protein [Litoreibacter ponti]PTX56511.1 YcxB-like protein [Litoreibacter ponti]
MAITLTYSFTEDEFMRAARVLWSYRGIGDVGNWVLVGLSLIAGPALLLNGLWTGWLFLGAAAIFATITWARNRIWRRAFPKMVKYTAPITATFSPDGVHTVSAQGESTLPWKKFQSYAETPNYVFLFLSRRDFSVIPKSAAQDPMQIEELRDLMAANLPRAKMRWT